MSGKKVVAYVMAKNEEKNIGQCVDNLKWCDEVIVADTGSTDKTREIAIKHGAKVITEDFKGYGITRNNIVSKIEADWIVCFDADEFCTQALSEEINKAIEQGNGDAFVAPRRNFLFGKPVHYSGWYPDYRHPVAFKRDKCHYDQSQVHEKLLVDGKTVTLKEPFAHYSYSGLQDFMEKNKKYAELGAEKILSSGKQVTPWTVLSHSVWSFISIYFLKRGFLDGWQGLVIASSASYSKFFRYGLAYQKQKNISGTKPANVPYSLRD